MIPHRQISLLLVFSLLFVCLSASAVNRKTYRIQRGDTPIAISRKFNIPTDEILKYNEIDNGSLKAGETITIPFPGEVRGKKYKVKRGDSLARIADFHGVAQKDIRAANGMRSVQHLKVGQTITIPHGLRGGAFKKHLVRRGDSLGSVAKKYKVTIEELSSKNKLKTNSPLERGRTLIIPDPKESNEKYKPTNEKRHIKTGTLTKNGVRHIVQSGQTLSIVASAYGMSANSLARSNGMDKTRALSIGQGLFVPGAKEVRPVLVRGISISPIRFVRVWNDQSVTLTLVGKSGAVNPRSRKELSELSGPKTGNKNRKLLHPRLMILLQKVADQFPGKTIEIISGVRPYEGGHESKHALGRAVDFRIRGVKNRHVYDFIKKFPNVGAGYYPNSVFVHLDVRDKRVLWTDYSAPGEGSRYKKSKTTP